MKCPKCGCEDFVVEIHRFAYANFLEDNVLEVSGILDEKIEFIACTKCGQRLMPEDLKGWAYRMGL